MSQQGLRRRVQELAASMHQAAYNGECRWFSVQDSEDVTALLAALAKAKRENALSRKLARMSGVDKHWWKVGGVTL